MTDLARRELEDLIEALIALLDDTDGCCDDEDADTGIADMDGVMEQSPMPALWVV